MTTVALFGGSFNPPHVAHQLVALYVLETCAVDELWFVPTFAHPFQKALAPFEHRARMCELAAAALGPRVQVSRAEAEHAAEPGFVASRTVELVERLRARAPDRAFRLVIGADILGETDKWHRWDDLVALAPPIVIGRPGAVQPAAPGAVHAHGIVMPDVVMPDVVMPDVVMPNISATRVRALLAARDPSVGALVPASVLRYIAAHGLYS